MRLSKSFLPSLALLFLSFTGKAQPNQTDSPKFFDPDNFLSDTLYIKTRFMECGEFGGHLELAQIYLLGKDFYINYQKFSADCSTIKQNSGETSQHLVKIINKKLQDTDKLLIRNYYHKLVDAKFREPVPTHAGYIFEISKSDKSIYLHVYTWGITTLGEYLEFINNLIE